MRWSIGFAFLLCGVPAVSGDSAPSTLGVSEITHRWISAVGDGRAPRKVYLRADALEDGIAGRIEEWLDGDSWRRVTTQADRTTEEVCRDGAAWTKDWNGKVLELRGRDLREQRADASIEALLYGAADREISAGDVAQLASADDTPTGRALRFTPKDGAPFDVYLDPGTWLPSRIVRKPAGDTITLEVSDWREVGGRMFPFSLRRMEGDGDSEATVTVRQVKPGGRAPAEAIGRPADGPKDFRFASGRQALGIPFNFENDHLMVSGRINGGKPLWFMLDTGAEATIINKARIGELGVKTFGSSSISGGGNTTDFAFADVARLEIGGVSLLNQRDGVIDLSGLERIYGMPMGGLLGYDFFSRFVVRVDYDTKTIDLLEPSVYVARNSGVAVPFVLLGRRPHVASTITVPSIPPIESDLIVDAGAADTVNLTSPFVRANRLLEFARKKPAGGPNTMAGSEKEFFAQTSVRGKLSAITLGTFTLKDIPSNLMVGSKGAYASERFSGTIGQGVLHRFNTVYDYSRNAMVLEPNADFDKAFPARRTFGATLLSDGADYTTFTITGVRKDSPAETAGLVKGDVIVAADGKPAGELRLADLRRLLADEGAHHVLTVKRGSGEVTIDLVVTLVSIEEI